MTFLIFFVVCLVIYGLPQLLCGASYEMLLKGIINSNSSEVVNYFAHFNIENIHDFCVTYFTICLIIAAILIVATIACFDQESKYKKRLLPQQDDTENENKNEETN